MGTGLFPGVKRSGRRVDHPPPSSAEVKERVELYLCSPFVPSWPFLGWTVSYLYVDYRLEESEDPGIDPRCRRGFFPLASDCSMCPGVDSASKNEYQDNPGGKDGRCVRLTIYHLHVPIVKKSGGLNLLEPCGPVQTCIGTAFTGWKTEELGFDYG